MPTIRSKKPPSISKAIGGNIKPRSSISAVSVSDKLTRTACSNARCFSESAATAPPANLDAAQPIVQAVYELRILSYTVGLLGGAPGDGAGGCTSTSADRGIVPEISRDTSSCALRPPNGKPHGRTCRGMHAAVAELVLRCIPGGRALTSQTNKISF